MAVRKVGDVYELPSANGMRYFLRQLDVDATQLSSQVVEIFNGVSEGAGATSFEFLQSTPVHFYAHVFLKAGEVLSLWTKVGRAPVLVKPELFWYSCPPEELGQP
jgi:hypothetical protein